MKNDTDDADPQTAMDSVVEALRNMPEKEWSDIAPRVMDRVRAEDQAGIDVTIAALRALPRYAGRDLVPGVMAEIRRMELRGRRLLAFRRCGVAACAALLLGLGLRYGLVRETSSGPESAIADVDLSTPEAGAAWLLAAQLPGGGWDTTALGGRPEHKPALTALGLLALHRQDADGNREAVLRGVEALCALQNADGSFGRGDARRINQGLVTAVLQELNPSLRSGSVGESLASALSFSRRAMAMKDGSWGYSDGPSRNADAALFASGFPSGRETSSHSLLDEELQFLPRSGPGPEENRFYQNCLVALNLR